jgi:predicted SAM-dependent methyltransferase
VGDVKRRLIAGTINYHQAEEGWANVHMDKSARPLWDVENGVSVPADVVWDISELTGSPPDDYDEIRCWQTLEHIDPARTELVFAGFYRILKPGGVLDIETPNLDAICDAWNGDDEFTKEDLLNGIYGTPNHDMFLDSWMMLHVNGFWPTRMEALLAQAGFDPGEQLQNPDPEDQRSLQLHYRAIKPDPNAVNEQDIKKIPERIEKAGAAAGLDPEAEAAKMAATAKKKAAAKKPAAGRRKGGSK